MNDEEAINLGKMIKAYPEMFIKFAWILHGISLMGPDGEDSFEDLIKLLDNFALEQKEVCNRIAEIGER